MSVSLVIFRRGWCPSCQRETLNQVRVVDQSDEDKPVHESVECTECKDAIDPA